MRIDGVGEAIWKEVCHWGRLLGSEAQARLSDSVFFPDAWRSGYKSLA